MLAMREMVDRRNTKRDLKELYGELEKLVDELSKETCGQRKRERVRYYIVTKAEGERKTLERVRDLEEINSILEIDIEE